MIPRNLLLGLLLTGVSTGADYRTYVIDPPINDNPILEGEALPVECRDKTVMSVMCARGEYEPASFLVETDAPLKQVMVKVGPLKGWTWDPRMGPGLAPVTHHCYAVAYGQASVPFSSPQLPQPHHWFLKPSKGELLND